MKGKGWLLGAFALSGFAALIYQNVWQRALFRIYGIDSESVTVVVTAFMVGLGIGSFWGGELSRGKHPLRLFAVFEIIIGLFGWWSLDIFEGVGSITLGVSRLATALITLGLLLVPTLAMGATLPLLVADAARRTRNVGRSVGVLYFVNTLGAAIACFATALLLFRHFGLEGTTRIAAVLNLVLGASVLGLSRGESEVEQSA